MRRISLLLVLAAATPAQVAQRSEALGPKDFEFRAPMEVAEPADYGTLRLDRSFYEHTRSRWGDLRVFSPRNEDVPWTFRDDVPPAPAQPPAVRIQNRVRTPTGALQFVTDFGRGPVYHDAITLHLSGDEFRRNLRLESSQDGHRWDFVRDGAILRFQQDGQRLEYLTVEYSASTRRYLRVTIENWSDPAALTGVTARTAARHPVEWEDLGSYVVRVVQRKDGMSVWECELPFREIDSGRITLETPAAEFARSVSVSSSTDGKLFIEDGSRLLYRVPDAEQLSLLHVRIHGPRLRIKVVDGDNSPLQVSRIRLEVPVREIVLPARTPGQYRVYLGRPSTGRPDWDLGEVLRRRGEIQAVRLTSSAWEKNPDYVPPEAPPVPFSERYPGLLTGVVIAAAMGMGFGAWRLMRKAS